MAVGVTGGRQIQDQGTIGGLGRGGPPSSDAPRQSSPSAAGRDRRVRAASAAARRPTSSRAQCRPPSAGRDPASLRVPEEGGDGLRLLQAQAEREQLADRDRRVPASRRRHHARPRRRRADAGLSRSHRPRRQATLGTARSRKRRGSPARLSGSRGATILAPAEYRAAVAPVVARRALAAARANLNGSRG